VSSGTVIPCDLCIVGAGPAGIAIADRLIDSGLSLVLLESGGFEPDRATQKLFRGDNRGHDYYRIDSCRYRFFGGSSNRWGGFCRPFDAVDFRKSDWLPWSGWPITEKDLKPYYADTARLFGLPNDSFTLSDWGASLPRPMPLDGTNFTNAIFQYNAINFGEAYRSKLIAARDISTILYANLTEIELSDSKDHVSSLRVATLTGRAFSIKPRQVVLATGGIENARLLLASNRQLRNGLGNEHDLVGRFFMEHLHVAAGHIIASPAAGDRQFYRRHSSNGIQVGGVVIPTADAQDTHRLLTTSIALESASYSVGRQRFGHNLPIASDAMRLYSRARASRFRPLIESLRRNVLLAANVPRRYRTWNKANLALSRSGPTSLERVYSLYFRAAQAPDPDSRITLSTKRDALGLPQVQLNWRVNRLDLESITGWLELLGKDLSDRGLGCVSLPEEHWEQTIVGGPHHMGTTRMAADPKAGVVDGDCKLHAVDNLYIAGSSVFSTGGYANPTFTIVALALRLADSIRNRLAE
jgi:choline dehydrogenase-like flavoprotein